MITNQDISDKRLLSSLQETSQAIHEKLLRENELYKMKFETDRLIDLIKKGAKARDSGITQPQQGREVLASEVEPQDEENLYLGDLSHLPRAHAAVTIMDKLKRGVTLRTLGNLLAQNGFDMSGNAIISLNNSLVRFEQQGITTRVKSNGLNLWTLNDSEEAREKIERIVTTNPSSNGHSQLTLGDIAERAIRTVGHRLSLNQIMKAENEAGRNPSLSTLRSGLIRDSQKRFKRTADGAITLTDPDFEEKEIGQANLL